MPQKIESRVHRDEITRSKSEDWRDHRSCNSHVTMFLQEGSIYGALVHPVFPTAVHGSRLHFPIKFHLESLHRLMPLDSASSACTPGRLWLPVIQRLWSWPWKILAAIFTYLCVTCLPAVGCLSPDLVSLISGFQGWSLIGLYLSTLVKNSHANCPGLDRHLIQLLQ